MPKSVHRCSTRASSFGKGALVEKDLDPFAGGQLALLVLAFDFVLTATAPVGGQPL